MLARSYMHAHTLSLTATTAADFVSLSAICSSKSCCAFSRDFWSLFCREEEVIKQMFLQKTKDNHECDWLRCIWKVDGRCLQDTHIQNSASNDEGRKGRTKPYISLQLWQHFLKDIALEALTLWFPPWVGVSPLSLPLSGLVKLSAWSSHPPENAVSGRCGGKGKVRIHSNHYDQSRLFFHSF